MILDIQEILSYLPHRYPFLLIDRVLEFQSGKSLIGIKNVTINEPFFTGHFPQSPIMPGVLIVEALAQASGLIILKSNPSVDHAKYLCLLAGVDNVRFRRMVVPGDQLRLKTELIRSKRDMYKFSCEAFVEDEIACSAEIINVQRPIDRD